MNSEKRSRRESRRVERVVNREVDKCCRKNLVENFREDEIVFWKGVSIVKRGQKCEARVRELLDGAVVTEENEV